MQTARTSLPQQRPAVEGHTPVPEPAYIEEVRRINAERCRREGIPDHIVWTGTNFHDYYRILGWPERYWKPEPDTPQPLRIGPDGHVVEVKPGDVIVRSEEYPYELIVRPT